MSIKTYSVPNKKKSIALLAIVAGIATILCADAAKAGKDTRTTDQIVSHNAIMEQAFRNIPTSSQKIEQDLIDAAHKRSGVFVIVRLRDGALPYGFFSDKEKPRSAVISTLQEKVIGDVAELTAGDPEGRRVKRFTMLPAFALWADATMLEALQAHPNVIDIVEDKLYKPTLRDSVPLIGAGPDGSFSGYTGQGQAVVIIDTGVDKNHPFLNGKVVSEACYSTHEPDMGLYSLCPKEKTKSTAVNSGLHCDLELDSGCMHGTHVAGIAAGNGGGITGVAKDANIIAIQVFSSINDEALCDGLSSCIYAFESDVALALERVHALHTTYAIAAANLSLAGGEFAHPCNDAPVTPIIATLRLAGIATVVASGNAGYTNAIASPACVGNAVSVGSTTKADEVSSFSNSAYFLSLLAPGSDILSAVPEGGSAVASGTSMAAPHVAGAWAVMKEAKENVSVTEALITFQNTGVLVSDMRPDTGIRGKPRIDVQAALDAFEDCSDNIDCDDGVFCNGEEACVEGTCVFGTDPCPGEECDETTNQCWRCANNADCDDGWFCNGAEICSSGLCYAGTGPCIDDKTPICEESDDRCVECRISGHCDDGICSDNICIPGIVEGFVRVDKCKVKAGKNGKGDSMKFSGVLDAYPADFDAAMGGNVTVSIEAEGIPDLKATTYTFPIPETYLKKGKYKSPKTKSADKIAPVTSFACDTNKGTIKFSGKNLDLTGLSCPITVKVKIGNYIAETVVDEYVVNGTKPCPPELMKGI